MKKRKYQVFSYILAQWLQMGVIGIAIAMCMNWIASAIAYTVRLKYYITSTASF